MVHRIPAASWDTLVPVALAPSHPFVLVSLDLGARSYALRIAGGPRDGCGCDLCDVGYDELDEQHDAFQAAFLDMTDLAPMPWELGWTADLALVVDEIVGAGEIG